MERGYRPTYCAVHFIMFLLRFRHGESEQVRVNSSKENDMKEFSSHAVRLVFVFEIVHFFSPLWQITNQWKKNEEKKANETHVNFPFISFHSMSSHCKPNWHVLMHKMFIHMIVFSFRSCFHSLQFFFRLPFSHFKSNLNCTICPSGVSFSFLLDLMPALTLLRVCVCVAKQQRKIPCKKADFKSFIFLVYFFPHS